MNRSPERRADHTSWIDSLGFSDEDKRRIRALADEVTENFSPPALDDLSVPVRVGGTPMENRRWMGGDLLGVVTNRAGLKVALLYWRLDGRQREAWARRRSDRA